MSVTSSPMLSQACPLLPLPATRGLLARVVRSNVVKMCVSLNKSATLLCPLFYV